MTSRVMWSVIFKNISYGVSCDWEEIGTFCRGGDISAREQRVPFDTKDSFGVFIPNLTDNGYLMKVGVPDVYKNETGPLYFSGDYIGYPLHEV